MIARNWGFDEGVYFKVWLKARTEEGNREVEVYVSLMKTSNQLSSVHYVFVEAQMQHQTGVFLESVASLWLAKYITGTVFGTNQCNEGCCCCYTMNKSRINITSNHNTWKEQKQVAKSREMHMHYGLKKIYSWDRGVCWLIFPPPLSPPVSHIHTRATADKHRKKLTKAIFYLNSGGRLVDCHSKLT